MKVSSEKIEGCQVALNVEVEPEEMDKALDKAYHRLVNKVVVPGFRKGKAPRDMMERHIGREALVSEALDHLVPELYDRALDEQKIEAIGQPKLEMTQVEPTPIFKAIVPVRPVVELGDYHSIKVTPEKVEVSDSQIDKAIENLRHIHSSWEPVERETRTGDMVAIDITGEVEGNCVIDKKGTMYPLTAGSESPVPGFPEQIIGMKIGEEKQFTLPFPADYPTKEVAGKDCSFKVSVSEIKEEHLPDINDDFVKSLNEGLDTVDQLRERVTTNLKTVAERDAKSKLETQAVEAAVGLSKVEFPDVLVEHEVDHMAQQELMRMGGMKLESYLGYRGVTEETFRGELRAIAQKKVANSLILNEVCLAEKIEIGDSDIDAEIERIAQNAKEQGDQLRQMFGAPQMRDSLKNELLTRKTVGKLVEIATSKDESGEEVKKEGGNDSTA